MGSDLPLVHVVAGVDIGVAGVHVFDLTFWVGSSAGHEKRRSLSLGVGQTAWLWTLTLACPLFLVVYIRPLGGHVYHSCGSRR